MPTRARDRPAPILNWRYIWWPSVDNLCLFHLSPRATHGIKFSPSTSPHTTILPAPKNASSRRRLSATDSTHSGSSNSTPSVLSANAGPAHRHVRPHFEFARRGPLVYLGTVSAYPTGAVAQTVSYPFEVLRGECTQPGGAVVTFGRDRYLARGGPQGCFVGLRIGSLTRLKNVPTMTAVSFAVRA